jgi:hypothetical protein
MNANTAATKAVIRKGAVVCREPETWRRISRLLSEIQDMGFVFPLEVAKDRFLVQGVV